MPASNHEDTRAILRDELATLRWQRHALLESASVAVVFADPEFTIQSWNHGAETIYGWTAEEAIGRRVGDLIQTQFSDRTPDEARNEFLADGVWSGEAIQTRKDGQSVVVQASLTLVKDEAGQPLGIVAVNLDITERKQVEASLRMSERRMANLLENLPGIVYRCAVDRDWTMEFVSEGVERVTGYAAEAIIGSRDLSYGDLIHPDDRDRVWHSVQKAIDRGRNFQIEYRIRDAQGNERHVWEQGNAVSDDGSDLVELEGYITDVTDLKQAEEDRYETEEKYRVLVENADVFVSLFDRDGICLLMNRRIANAFGGEPEQFVGRSIVDLHPESGEEWIRRLRVAIDTDTPRHYEDVVRFPVGVYHLLSNVQPVRDSEGRIYAAQTISQDITELRNLESQLQQSQKLESIGRLAGGVAHDFNNVITVINNYCDLIADDISPNDPVHKDLAEIQRAARRAAELTQQLLAFSRKQIIEPQVIDINAVITKSEQMLRRLIGEDIELEFDPATELHHVRFDPGQLDQILFNLAVNSRDAMPDGGKLLIETANTVLNSEYCRQHSLASPGDHVLVAVSDTGHGMDEETLNNVFEPFFTTKEVGQGTGLGLSTVYGIVKQHGGAIEATSTAGMGTKIRIYLPRAYAETTEAAPRIDGDIPGGRETILLVEDDAAVRDIAERILATRGYRVIATAGAGDAILACQQTGTTIDLVLTDVVMPIMSGKECYEKMRQIRPGLKVLYMSGYSANTIADRGVLDEETQFIAKPFTLTRLAQKVREVLDS